MEVYHASTIVVESPDTTHSRAFLDFGPGFYVTTLQEQAVKYGARFTNRDKEAFLNVYELADDLSKWKVFELKRYDEAWLDFVTECRQGRVVGDYDVVSAVLPTTRFFVPLTSILQATYRRKNAFAALSSRNLTTKYASAHSKYSTNV